MLNLPKAESGDTPLRYELMPEPPLGLSFDDACCRLSGKPIFPMSDMTYTYRVRDADGDTASLTFTITVVDEPEVPTFLESIAPQLYRVGEEIGSPLVNLPAASGGSGTLEYLLDTEIILRIGLNFFGDIPPSGVLHGTPDILLPETTFIYMVRDDNGVTVELPFTITVIDPEVPTFLESIDNQYYRVGGSIDAVTLPAATGGQSSLAYALMPAGLPAGLSFNASGRTLSGTAPDTELSATTYIYTAPDGSNTDSLTFTISIKHDQVTDFDQSIADQRYDAGIAIEPLSLPKPNLGNEPLRYCLTPEPPEGLSFDADARTLSGTPRPDRDMAETTLHLYGDGCRWGDG